MRVNEIREELLDLEADRSGAALERPPDSPPSLVQDQLSLPLF